MASNTQKAFFKLGLITFFALTNLKCGQLKSTNSVINGLNKRISPDYNGPSEPSYCVGAVLYSNPLTISGSAKFEYRLAQRTSAFKGLGDIESTTKPIRVAEFVVLNNSGQIIQCGETDTSGNFSFEVPQTNEVYRLQIRSRADNNSYKVSVLRSPESNEIYILETAFTANSNQTLNLVAKATGNLLGGAFNILDQIYEYNEKLRTLVSTCPTGSATGCVPFTVAPKVSIYWEKGFNPGSYLTGSPATSYYYTGLNRLFILGGINGDVNYSDTDHFDNSIIAHEYFHFLEDNFSQSDSPGGNHNGNSIIDPRLAWSEGVAQFFQAVMTNINRVLDTVGNSQGSTQLIVDYSVENAENDIPLTSGEGEFREFSIARLLWDTHDDTPAESSSSTLCTAANIDGVHDKCAKNGFVEFWSVITGANGFNNPIHKFISSGLFHQLHTTIASGSDKNLNPLRSFESQDAQRTSYARRMVTCGSATTLTKSAPFASNVSGQMVNSHQVRNNGYYYFDHAGGPLAIQLSATFTNGLVADPDLYLFPEDYTFASTTPLGADLVQDAGAGYLKSIAIPTNLAAGSYMIIVNVRNFNSANGDINFTLQTGADLSSLGGLCASP